MPGDLDIAIRIRADLKNAQKNLSDLEKELGGVDRETKKTSRSMTALQKALGALSVAAFIEGLRRMASALKETGLEFEALEQRFSFGAGSMAQGARDFRFVREEAERLGISFTASAGGFASLSAAARGTFLEGEGVRTLFLALAEASTVMRLSNDATGRAFTAFEQIISKGKFTMEEMLQIAEAIPGGLQILSRATGRTTQQLAKDFEQGEVTIQDFLAWAIQLRKEVGPAVEDAAGSAAASFARLGNAWERVKESLSDAGFLDTLASVADIVADIVDNLSGAGIRSLDDQIAQLVALQDLAAPGSDPRTRGGRTVQGVSRAAAIEADIIANVDRAQIDAFLERIRARAEGIGDELAERLAQLQSGGPRTRQALASQGGLQQQIKLLGEELDALLKIEAVARRLRADIPVTIEATDPQAPGGAPTEKELKAAEDARQKTLADIRRFQDRVRSLEDRALEQAIVNYERRTETINDRHEKGLISQELAERAHAASLELLHSDRAKIRLESEKELARQLEDLRKEEQRAAEQLAREAERLREAQADALAHLERLEQGLTEPYARGRHEAEAWYRETVDFFRQSGVDVEVWGDTVRAVFLEKVARAHEELTERLLRESRRWRDGARRALQDYSLDATNAAENAERAFSNSFQGAEDALVRFSTTGKLEIGSLADSIIADLARIAIRQRITGPLAAAFAGIFGGGGAATNSFNPAGPFYQGFPVAHGGGTAGQINRHRYVDPRIFIGAPRYHNGGVAGDEVPTILRRGERIIPEGEPAGVAMPPLQINFINQGTPQQEVGRSLNLDPIRGFVLDVMVEDAVSVGPHTRALRRTLTPGV